MSGDLLIAIVDDDDSTREATVDLVQAVGFAAAGFASAAELLASENLRQMACLIADVRMPRMDGLELYRHLAGSSTPIPTILMTAHPEDDTRARALEAGVQCYLEKPLEVGRLIACVRSAVGEHGGQAGRVPQRE
jgi:FixJ family two-component response regulator